MLASRFAPQLVVLAVLVASRLLTHALGLAPDPAIAVNHWQHIDLRMLAANPFGALWDLHAQPPLWNSILALVVTIVGPSGQAVTAVIYGLNLVLTAGAGLLTLSILRRFGFSPFAAAAFAALSICSPNVFYYETYIFYPHFTYFMVTLLIWLLVQIRRDGAIWPVASALGVIVALSWTWAVFHPIFVAASAVGLAVWHRGWTWRGPARLTLALAALAVCVSTLPTIKNYVLYGVPAASTWIGLNLAQTIPGGQTGEFVACDFQTAHANAVAGGPGLSLEHPLLTQGWKRPGAPNMNHAGMIAQSLRCLEMTKGVIARDPLAWLGSRIATLAGTHQLSPSSYDMDPVGWDRIFGAEERLTASLGYFGRSAMILWYLVLVTVAVKHVRSNPPVYLSLLWVAIYFTLVTHIVNGGEQARMRYTIEPIYLFFSAVMLLAAAKRFAPQFQLARRLAQGV